MNMLHFALQVASAPLPDWATQATCIPAPSLTSALTWAGMGKYTAGIVSFGVAAKAALPEIMPWLNVPNASSSKAYSFIYGLMARATGNYGKNAPVPVFGPPAGGIVPTPPSLK